MSARSFDPARCPVERQPPGGFTLVELLVVVSIIAVLAALLLPVLAAVREQTPRSTCLSNLRQIGAAHRLYLQDWDERFPRWLQDGTPAPKARVPGPEPMGSYIYRTELLQPYMPAAAVFQDPSFAWPPGAVSEVDPELLRGTPSSVEAGGRYRRCGW